MVSAAESGGQPAASLLVDLANIYEHVLASWCESYEVWLFLLSDTLTLCCAVISQYYCSS